MPRSIFATLQSHGDRPCLIEGARVWTHAQAVEAADALFADPGLPDAGLAFLAGHASAETLLAYIGACRRGYAVHILDASKPEANARLAVRYRPDVTVDMASDPPVRATGPGQGVSPDIAILLSTSGSTGTPKLVKLSHGNIAANTDAIVSYLALTGADVGITSLRPYYSYGMSVVNTHLAAGGTLVVTDRGVEDPAFWALVRQHRVTNVAGVPFTFELLHRTGFDLASVPSLRLITQAGGRLAPDLVRHFARTGAAHGVEFCVMYGQTEAAPRMSWLPPHLAEAAPGSIGRAIPGGKLSILDVDGDAIAEPGRSGELVYEGPNVMVGYAQGRADLAATEVLPCLHTGDIAHFDENGLFYIDGRTSRFVKPNGVRVSLDDIERDLVPDFPEAAVTGDDRRIVVALGAARTDPDALVDRLATATALPPDLFIVVQDRPIPRLANGKVDYTAMLTAHAAPQSDAVRPSALPMVFVREFLGIMTGRGPRPASVLDAFRLVLGARVADRTATFRSAGGDSLSYLQLYLLLEDCMGAVPAGWDEMSVQALEDLREPAHA
jgi:acyl-coenzyme A synthetase/AMP-(fatty) acid ligase